MCNYYLVRTSPRDLRLSRIDYPLATWPQIIVAARAFKLSFFFVGVVTEMAHLNGSVDHDQGEMENVDEEEPVLQLEFLDEVHHSSMLKSLNMMRKNRHFCDVILHVCAWLYNQTDFTRVCTVTLNVQVIDDFFW